jgi:hypothetical protein
MRILPSKCRLIQSREQPLTNKQQSFLRGEFKVPVGDFAFILIGKDGTVKLRSNQTVLSGDLFALIDSMPMRREEMGRKASTLSHL